MVFANIAKFKQGDTIQVVWEGKLYEYKVINIVIVYPEDVNDEYKKYARLQDNYLTLM
jgi:LPXTG-site transpeptidase (sortase) family protein